MRMDFNGLILVPEGFFAVSVEMVALYRRKRLVTFAAAETFNNWERCRIAMEEDIENHLFVDACISQGKLALLKECEYAL